MARVNLEKENTMRVIHLSAIDRHVSLTAYVAAVKTAKAHPERTFSYGLTTWWPTTGAEILNQFHGGMMERINQAIPYVKRGVA
jgi:hypothetical protein